MSQYGITATNLPDSHEAAMARNIYEAGTELLNTTFPNISNYYYDIAVEYAGGGLLNLTRVWIEAMPTEAAQTWVLNDGSAPSGTIGNSFDLTPTQYATQAPYTAIGIKRATVRQAIEDGQVVWRVDGYQTEAYITNSQTGFYDNSHDDAELTILQSTVPVTFNDDIPWIFQTYHDTPLLTYSPPQSFLDGLNKESDYYISYYLGKVNGDTASNAQRIYFKKDPGTIHVRTCPTGNNTGWYISWDNPDETDQAWNYNLSNANGTSDDWSMTGGSGGWAHEMFEYDSSRSPQYGYRVLQPYWLFIFESSVPIVFNGVEIQPSVQPQAEGDYFFFNKDPDNLYNLIFGVRATEYSTHLTPGQDEQWFAQHYQTKEYYPVLAFRSPVDNQQYVLHLKDIVQLESMHMGQALDPELSSPWGDLYYQVMILAGYQELGSPDSFIRGVRGLHSPKISENPVKYQSYPQSYIESATYSDMTDGPSINELRLADIVEYYKLTNPNFSSNDLFTVLRLNFYDVSESSENPPLAESLEVDYSSLFNSGADVTGDGQGTPGHSWDPTGTNKDDPELNPKETDHVDLIRSELTPLGLFSRTFALTYSNVIDLGDELTTTDSSVIKAILEGLQMFGANPINAIVDLRLYPFDITTLIPANIQFLDNIWLGRHNTHIEGLQLTNNLNCILNLGSIYIQPKYYCFLDYEPYTSIRLYIPYVGTVDLQPSLFMDKTLSVRLIVDFTTGACVAVVYANGIPLIFQQGVIGTSITVTGDNAAAYANGIIGNLIGTVGSAAKAIGGALGASSGASGAGSVSGIGSGISGVISGVSNLMNSFNDVQFQQAGSTSPACANWMPQKCHIAISRPVPALDRVDQVNAYGYINGFATAKYCHPSELGQGINYAILNSIDVPDSHEPAITEAEFDMIKSIMNSGFYKSRTGS